MNQMIAWGASAILAIGSIWAIVGKYLPKIRKAMRLTEEALDLLNTLLDSLEDRKITKQEVELIANKLNDLQEVLK